METSGKDIEILGQFVRGKHRNAFFRLSVIKTVWVQPVQEDNTYDICINSYMEQYSIVIAYGFASLEEAMACLIGFVSVSLTNRL